VWISAASGVRATPHNAALSALCGAAADGCEGQHLIGQLHRIGRRRDPGQRISTRHHPQPPPGDAKAPSSRGRGA
jgi:hypothetical protein